MDSRVKATARQVRLASDIADDKNVLVLGTVGQGKSIFLRYLCLEELREGRKIPVFLELRHIGLASTLRATITETLSKIGFGSLQTEEFDFLLKNGCFIFFLDGFDEIKRELALSIQGELSQLMRFAPQTRWILSSRPGSLASHITELPFLKRVYLAPLADDDFEPFLKALNVDAELRLKLIEAIQASPLEVRGVLRTPLMLTLLNLTFGTSAHVPATLHEFYESMFLFLVYRHDETKQNFVRTKATQLSNSELQDAFEHFAFLSKEYGVSLTDEEFSQCAKSASKLCGNSFTSEGFKADLTETVCLMMPDGLRTAFIHRSIQEFFSAFFVKHLGAEDQVKRIYERMGTGECVSYQQEIRFLEQIDKFRFIEYLRLPAIRRFLSACNYSSTNVAPVSKADFLAYMATQPIICAQKPEGKNQYWIIGNRSDPTFDLITLELAKLYNCDGFVDGDVLRGSKKNFKLDRLFSKRTTEAQTALIKFREFVKRIAREQTRLEKVLAERKNYFRDLLLPSKSASSSSNGVK